MARKAVVYRAQIYKGDPRTCAIFIPAWGSNWGFPVIKVTVIRQVRTSPASAVVCGVKLTPVKCHTVREDRGHICFAFVFCVCGWQKPEDP